METPLETVLRRALQNVHTTPHAFNRSFDARRTTLIRSQHLRREDGTENAAAAADHEGFQQRAQQDRQN